MRSSGDEVPVRDAMPLNGTDTRAPSAFKRVLVPVADTSQLEQVAELVRRAGASEARVLHLSLREIAGGRRFPLETESAATQVTEATVLELRMAGIAASGQVRHTLVGRAARAIVAEAAEWEADLIVLGFPHRGELATRLLGSVTLGVLEHSPCPVLVASAAGKNRLHRAEEGVAAVTAPDADISGDHPAGGQSNGLSTAPAR